MFKAKRFFVLISFVFFSVNCGVWQRLKDIKIYDYSGQTRSWGVGNYNIKTNGELRVMKHIVKPGDIVFDVGANAGEWSECVFSVCSGITVHAFEPIPSVFATLKSRVSRNRFFAHNVALSDYVGTCKFYHCLGNRGDYEFSRLSSFYNRECYSNILRKTPAEIDVKTVTIDFFCEDKGIEYIDFLKIDTEGAELKVLTGAQNMLSQQKIGIVQFEYGGCYKDSQSTLHEVYTLLSICGYSVFRICSQGLVRVDQWKDKLEDFKYSNYLAVRDSNCSKKGAWSEKSKSFNDFIFDFFI